MLWSACYSLTFLLASSQSLRLFAVEKIRD
jgi:hypothetical protein